ncbi:MAG TPA: hypothetical protein VMT85_16025 [Thermoanaerobaculia bacterium]|nr:hypothetical protein [Thermoanaerobaculia bacterium]
MSDPSRPLARTVSGIEAAAPATDTAAPATDTAAPTARAAPATATTFLISPASLHGVRGRRLLAPGASGVWPRRLRGGAPIGELFTAVSSLYFRGKLAYALRFGGAGGTLVIAPGVGLVTPEWRLDREAALRMSEIRVRSSEDAYRRPLEQALRRLLDETGGDFVFLGSLATDRYLAVLAPLLGSRLLTPAALYGMGNMRRGSVLLEAAESGEELEYVPCRPPQARRSKRPPER